MDVIKYPSPILRAVSKEIEFPISQEDKNLLNELFAYVKENAETAAGLSAVQVGILKRACAIRFKVGDKLIAYKLVNPKIISHSTKVVFDTEGCLSVDEDHSDVGVGRWESVRVSAYDLIQNKFIIINARGFEARVLQHEIDHMDGKLYIDYLA